MGSCLTLSNDNVASLSSPESGVSIAFASNQPGMQGWSGTKDTYNGSDARKILHGGKSERGTGDGYLNEISGAAFAMEFHASESTQLASEACDGIEISTD